MRFPSILNFVSEALNPKKALDRVKSAFSNTAAKPSTVELIVVDRCWFNNVSATGIQDVTPITVVYDQESLDSLYGLSFFVYLYGDRVQPVACHNAILQKDNIKQSSQTFVVGVDLAMDDLVRLDSLTGRTLVLAYRGSHDYLYEQSNHDKFRHLTLFMADYGFNIGGENIEQFENTMASMISILYFDHPVFQKWPQKDLRKMVAHATTMYATIPDYGLSKAKLVRNQDGVTIHNKTAAMMMDLRYQLEAAIAGREFAKMPHLQPTSDMTAYTVRRKRLAEHVARTIVPQAWKRKGGGNIACNTISGYSADVTDLVDIATFSKPTVVCVEDAGNVTNYYVYSSTPGRAADIANALKGDRRWRRGQMYCVQVNKSQNDRR
jgi:hypothetical protein